MLRETFMLSATENSFPGTGRSVKKIDQNHSVPAHSRSRIEEMISRGTNLAN